MLSHNPIQRVTPQKNISPHIYEQINYWFWKIFKVNIIKCKYFINRNRSKYHNFY